MGLYGQLYKELRDALIDAFPDKASLEQMLWFELDKNLNEIVGKDNLKVVVFKLIKKAQAENWVEDLIDAARKSNPGNLRLKNVAGKINEALLEKQLLEREKELEEQCIRLKKELQEIKNEIEKEHRITENLERQLENKRKEYTKAEQILTQHRLEIRKRDDHIATSIERHMGKPDKQLSYRENSPLRKELSNFTYISLIGTVMTMFLVFNSYPYYYLLVERNVGEFNRREPKARGEDDRKVKLNTEVGGGDIGKDALDSGRKIIRDSELAFQMGLDTLAEDDVTALKFKEFLESNVVTSVMGDIKSVSEATQRAAEKVGG